MLLDCLIDESFRSEAQVINAKFKVKRSMCDPYALNELHLQPLTYFLSLSFQDVNVKDI